MDRQAHTSSHYAGLSHQILRSQASVVFISAGSGYGKSALLRELVSIAQMQSLPSALVELSAMQSERAALDLVALAVATLLNPSQKRTSANRSVLAIDDAGRLHPRKLACLLKSLVIGNSDQLQIVVSTSLRDLDQRTLLPGIELHRLGPDELSIPDSQLQLENSNAESFVSQEDLSIIHSESGGWPGIVNDFLSANRSSEVSAATYISSQRCFDYIRRSALSNIEKESYSVVGFLSRFACIPSSIVGRGSDAKRILRVLSDLTALGYAHRHIKSDEIYYTIIPCIRHFALAELHEQFTDAPSYLEREIMDRLLGVGLYDHAIETAISLCDWESALSGLSKFGDDFFFRGKWKRLCEWSDLVPIEKLREDDHLVAMVMLSYAFLKDFDGLSRFSDRLNKNALRVGGCHERVVIDAASVMRLLHVGELDVGIPFSRRLLAEIPTDAPKYFHGLVSGLLGSMLLLSGEVGEAIAVLQAAVNLSQCAGQKFGVVFALSVLGYAYAVSGRFLEAVSAFKTIDEISAGDALLRSVSGGYFACVAYELGDFDSVARCIKEYESAWRVLPSTGGHVLMCQIKARMCTYLSGHHAGMVELDAALGRSSGMNRERFSRAVQLERRRLLIANGQVERLPSLPDAISAIVVFPSEHLECVCISQARELMARGESAAAYSLLLAEFEIANDFGLIWRRMKLYVLMSKALWLDGRKKESAFSLLKAASEWKEMKAIAVFFEEGDVVVELIHNAIRHFPKSRSLLDHLLAELKSVHLKSRLPLFPHSFSGDQALNSRERQILLLFSEGMPAKLVADKLIISTNTVKWHAANIFRKLGVKNKASAIAIARRTGAI